MFWKILFGVTGIGLLIGAYLLFRVGADLRRNGLRAEGTVIENVPYRTNGSKLWAPIISFIDDQGRQVEFTPSTHSAWKQRLGRKVRVLYWPDDSQNAAMDSWGNLWVAPSFCSFSGCRYRCWQRPCCSGSTPGRECEKARTRSGLLPPVLAAIAGVLWLTIAVLLFLLPDLLPVLSN